MTKKNSKDNPIKRITFDSNVASAIVTQIAIALGANPHTDRDEEGNVLGISAYIGNSIRLADHKTYLQTWVDNGTWNAPYRISIVIEDEETIGSTQVKEGYDFEVLEYVFKSDKMDREKVKSIAYDIQMTKQTGNFSNNSGGEKCPLKSTYNTLNKVKQNISMNCTNDAVAAHRYNHGADYVSESRITNENKRYKNMNRKNTIRLTESELKRVITESVKNILKEQQDGNVTDNPIINQLWNELMSINQGLIKDILQKYGWGKSKELGNGVFKQIVKVSEAINTFDAVLRNRTADSDYWAMSAHEQD